MRVPSPRPRNLTIAATLLLCPALAAAPALDVGKGDRVVFVGNTFAERLHLFGYFETFLHCRFPEHRLRIRNLGWSADELTRMPHLRK